MLPISLLIWIALEISGYLYIGRHFMQLDWPLAIVGAINCLLGLRFWMNATTWTFGMAFASPAPRLGFAKRLAIMLGEYLAFLLTFLLVIPFELLWMPADRLPAGSRPILLVHGYGCSRGIWWLLRRRLEAAGHTVASVSLIPPYTSLGKLVPQLNQRIEEVCAMTGSKQVTLIAHSMGGLICRSYLARHGSDRVDRLLTLATPHQGSALARIGIGKNAREMQPGSLWLRDMASEAVTIPFISLRNAYDNYAMPQDNQRLPGARDVELPPVGHIAMLYDKSIANLLIELLKQK
ncbi:esterase/lipase family protein [Ferribacterium limneticum]|uniref:esterase/lipase family protein n=1 Tax=Ferribacterium limneticum TaxID=76259 RepID=UPI001CFBCAD9|nr:alpha/beta fold hydrolase [Ferribacterium limneticum]UCV27118.1 alpha/beta fold hydrolase [Ferribacterium limneticum]UCV31035.1 alpha/beta fold hydrolase [Ferribacterium limneticum]